ncbi:hypothetical protein EIN_063230 [Entamoeba invadens IP1]|uniref:hypothetical protein n=1 Tax=Entamoeba invadens IP1 TaxID=370355 RepID=UPI0002C3DDA5|nr:hypothetical protein EIN_063230 [Entamoeba invadens IP1]ELP93598.1 hypothetical protein EIN_063230 [Entamoeba invadens IP1]|eukprot:XP_004260369.1 hypothetical protein EIN_063230 [Entamoeba invadens IP1]
MKQLSNPHDSSNEAMFQHLTQLTQSLNSHTILLNHIISYFFHIQTTPQAMSYLTVHEDSELKALFQSLYSFSQDDFVHFSDFSSEIASDEDETKKHLAALPLDKFQIALDMHVGRIPSSSLVQIVANMAAARTIDDLKVRYVEERIPVPYAVALSRNRSDEFSGLKPEYIKMVQDWTNSVSAKVIYNSEANGRDVSIFNSAVCGKHKIAVYVISGNTDVFGSYHTQTIVSPPKSRWEEVTGDHHFFVFSCKNSFGLPGAKYTPKSVEKSLILFPNRDITNIFAVSNCYQIGQYECTAMRKKDFIRNFNNVPDCGTELFSGLRNDKFVAQRIVVVQLD